MSHFVGEFWYKADHGGDKNHHIKVDKLWPPFLFHRKIHDNNGKLFNKSELIFNKRYNYIYTTKDGHLPYQFICNLLNKGKPIKIYSELLNVNQLIFNCTLQYSEQTEGLTFECDLRWKSNDPNDDNKNYQQRADLKYVNK